ncbi:MAG: hypothetical protein ABII26_05360 [Pseudomonadota bacterium]
MKIKIGDGNWQQVVLFDPPSRTVNLHDGTVWHIAPHRNEILELDLYMTPILEKYAPWEIEDKKTLALSRGKGPFLRYSIEIEVDDESKYEMFYFHKFANEEEHGLKFPDYLMEGECVEIKSAALRYFLADTLFFDFFIRETSSKESVHEAYQNMIKLKKKWTQRKGH